MASLMKRIKGQQAYTALPLHENEPRSRSKFRSERRRNTPTFAVPLLLVTGLAVLYVLFSVSPRPTNKSCDSVDEGYRCSPEISHFWGQYSLWFSVPSEIDPAPPRRCEVTFAQVLSRHGGRDPTISKTITYSNVIKKIHNNAKSYSPEYSFLKSYNYTLGADLLTNVGRQQMINSGINFYRRYELLLAENKPFVRSTDQDRVLESANKWLEGFAQEGRLKPPTVDVIISEKKGFNNSLSHSLCTAFEDGPFRKIGDEAAQPWAAKFLAPIRDRVNTKLPGANLTIDEALYLMDMCPFDTVGSPTGRLSEFCHLFSEKEWHQYDYFRSLDKYYSYMDGNPLGPTQGVGYVNELISRLTATPVKDSTSTNTTLDSDPRTFPLDRKVYADFSHDNDMTTIFGALGLYNETKPLTNRTIVGAEEAEGYSAAWTVPFAARAYFEKLKCPDDDEEFVRILVNDRVMPLEFCGGDKHGRCRLSKFVASQTFARSGGLWDQCFMA